MCDESQNLSNESHGWVAHGVRVPDIGLDDIVERLFHALKVIKRFCQENVNYVKS